MENGKSHPALEISDLSFSVGARSILSRVSFKVPKGEFLAVVGPNGAGKTTLLRCVVGVISRYTGAVTVDGRPLAAYRRRHLARLMSYVPQSDAGWFPFTGRELVMMGRYPYLNPFSPPGRRDLEVVERTLHITGTASLADRDIRTLSAGERQKILIAGALAQEAETMLLDEPTTFLDPRHTDEILSILSGLNRSGVTVVMVTHDINSAAAVSSRILALAGGEARYNGSVEAFMDNAVLEAVYGKQFTLVPHPARGLSMTLPGGPRP
ncbi:MAG: ABC transporter ATP-binding protein [bacterium]|nr:MAG: ABC transporter ATP-binding protein [bacterium]